MCESLKILAHIRLLCRDLEVMSQQSFVSLLQVFVTGMQSSVMTEDLVLLFSSVATTYFCCNSLLSFSMITLSRQSFFCLDNILCIPQTVMSQHR